MANETLLTLSGPGINPYSARGITQTLDLVESSSRLAETINGKTVNLSPVQFRKLKSTISFNDVDPPAFDSIWPGMILTVGCAKERSYKTSGGSPDRPVVSGSERVEGEYTYYRPELVMMVVSYADASQEYARTNQATLELVEVSADYGSG